MKNYAIIKDDMVDDVVCWCGNNEWEPSEGTIAVPYDIDGANPPGRGWSYANGKFAAPKNADG